MSAGEFLQYPGVQVGDRTKFVTLSATVYKSSSGRIFDVPAGFPTDLASVPRLGRGIVAIVAGFSGPIGTAAAAILHDGLYAHPGTLSRRQCDYLLWEALIATGEQRRGAWAMWVAVRLGGWVAWRKHRRNES